MAVADAPTIKAYLSVTDRSGIRPPRWLDACAPRRQRDDECGFTQPASGVSLAARVAPPEGGVDANMVNEALRLTKS